jgi:hypothetical protein
MKVRGETTLCSAEGASRLLRISQAKELLPDAALESVRFSRTTKGESLI